MRRCPARSGGPNEDFWRIGRTTKLGITEAFEIPSVAVIPGDDDGRFYATLIGPEASGNYIAMLARFNADGSLDPKFSPYPSSYNTGPSQITLLHEGRRLLLNMGDRLVRLDARGTEDTSFVVTTAGDPALDPTGYIVDVALQWDGSIVIAGQFNSVNGVPRNNIARVSPNGALDSSFDPGAGPDGYIAAVTLQPNGKILIAGYFQNYDGQPRPLLARLNANGSLDTSFNTGAGFGDSMSGFPSLTSVAVQSDGKLLVGGTFDSYQETKQVSLVRLLENGDLDPSFETGSGFESGFLAGAPGFVGKVVLQPDSKLLVSGSFSYFNGAWATGIVRLQPDGTLDPTFQLGGTDAIVAGVNSGAAVALLPDGDILVPLTDNVSFLRDDPIGYRGLVRLNGDGVGR